MLKSKDWTRFKTIDGNDNIAIIDSVEPLKAISLPRITETILSVVCLEGSVSISIDDKLLVMTPSDIMVLAPGHLLSSYEPSSDFKGFAINTTLGYIENMLPIMSRIIVCHKAFEEDPILKLNDDDLQSIIQYREILHRKLASKESPYKKWIINSICQAVAIEIFTFYFRELEPTQGKPNIKHNRSEELFYKFITLVEDNFQHTRSISDYASKLCISTKYLSALVKEVSGRTASSWIDSYVIFEAKKLLSSTDLSILQISEKLSFPNQSFFGKYFKHSTGMSPTIYRKQQIQPTFDA